MNQATRKLAILHQLVLTVSAFNHSITIFFFLEQQKSILFLKTNPHPINGQ